MKVLLGHCFYRTSAPSGEDSVYRREKQLLIDYGYDVVTYEKQNDDIEDSNLIGRFRSAQECVWSLRAYKEMANFLQVQKPDVVHFHNTFPQISHSVYLACKEQNVPVVQTLHNFRTICPNALLLREGAPCEDCLEANHYLPAVRHRCYRGSLLATAPLVANIMLNMVTNTFERRVSKFIALTKFGKSKFIQAGFAPDQITVKPNFINDVGVADSAKDYVIYIGRLKEEKGVRTLIDAWKHSQVPLKIVGDGELRSELEEKVRSLGLNVEFLGLQKPERVIQLLKEARFQIVPSICYEGFPAVIAESFACGKPVIASRIGSLTELIEEDRNGFTFKPGDSVDLADKVNQLYYDPKRMADLSLQARNTYERYYTPQRNIDLLDQIYSEVCRSYVSHSGIGVKV